MVGPQSSRSALVRIALRYMELWNPEHREAFIRLHHPGFLDHNPVGSGTTREALCLRLNELWAAFPDLELRAEILTVDEATETVTIRFQASGHHQHSYFACPPTHQEVAFEGIEILRVIGGRVCERWGHWDRMALHRQMQAANDCQRGVLPAPRVMQEA